MSTGPNHDLGLTEKRTGQEAPSGGCCGGDSGGGCGSGACGGICGSEPDAASASGGCGSGGGCACSSAAPAPTVRADTVIGAPRVSGSRARVSSVLEVTGMTRGRCIATVMNALEKVSGVDSVDVDLNSGGISRVTVISSAALEQDAVRSAIDQAGYALAGELIQTR